MMTSYKCPNCDLEVDYEDFFDGMCPSCYCTLYLKEEEIV